MGDVQVKCTYTYPGTSSFAQAEIEVHFEPRGHDSWRIHVAPVSLCVGGHKVSWTLVGTPVELTGFDLLGDRPGRVRLQWPPEKDPETGKWTTVLENMGVEATNGFSYLFYFKPKANSKPLKSSDFTHDPTIAVTPDPLEPPY